MTCRIAWKFFPWRFRMSAQSDLRFTFSAGPDEFEVVEFRLTEGLSETFYLIASER